MAGGVAGAVSDVKRQLAGFKAPKRVVFVSQVPRAPNGKADYKAAKQTCDPMKDNAKDVCQKEAKGKEKQVFGY